MSWNIIEDWESHDGMDSDKTVHWIETISDDIAGQISVAFKLLSEANCSEVRHSTAKLIRLLLLHCDK